MSSSRRAWIVATSIGAVEALKDQSFARWYYTMRLLHQYVKANITKYKYSHQANKRVTGKSSSRIVSNKMMREQKWKQSLRIVMYLSCWGPY